MSFKPSDFKPPTEGKKQSYATGIEAEWLVSAYFHLKGYSILARRYKVQGGEIDMIVKRGRALAFVEVKARRTLEEARGAITPTQIARIGRAARHFLSRLHVVQPHWEPEIIRFDAVLMVPWSLPHHIEAFAVLPIE